MANYTPTFTKPYPSGWVDKPSKTTPATAAIMNSYDTAIAALEAYLRDNAIDTVSVSVEQFPSDGRQWLGTITVGSDQYRIYMPSLKYENSVSDGVKIGTITLGEQSFDVYAPTSSAGGSTVSVVPKTLTGTNIAEITVDGTTYQLYAPTSGGSGSTVTAEATLTDGTQIGKITIDGVETILYAPTASPITVDSELSATSENAIQNKAIAEEFQKYANGTKVVAKATEAETAKTAASATTAQSATTAESATKATQDAKGNVIDTTYAKKTEVPQGTVVDDALSSTSANPVQNKVVKAEFDKVNSNLDTLEFGEVAGGKNLFDKNSSENVDGWLINGIPNGETTYNQKTSHFIRIDGNTFVYNKGNVNNKIAFYDINKTFISEKNQVTDVNVVTMPTNAKYVRVVYFDVEKDLVQIEEDTTATNYEPYIPSVKMLADEVSAQNDSLGNYGLDNKAKWNNGNINLDSGGLYPSDNNGIFTDAISCKEGDVISIHEKDSSSIVYIIFYNGSEHLYPIESRTATVPTNATNFRVNVRKTGITKNENINIYVNNAIEQIKNDLSNIKDGTTQVAKAVADEDGNNIKSTYAKKTEAFETVTEDVNVVLNSDLFDSTYSDITCVRIGKLCVLSFTIRVKNTIYSTIDEIVLMTIVGTKYRPKKPDVNRPRQTFQGFAVGNYDENGTQSQSLNNTVRIITSSANNYTEIITRDKDRINWSGYVQGQIMWVTD